MKILPSRFFFDRRDHALLRMVNSMRESDNRPEDFRKAHYPHLHPHGIKELAESKGLRIAYAVFHLLNSLEVGRMADRLSALKSLRDEVQDSAMGPLPRNTARILVAIMKELVRSGGNYRKQLMLAHDFRMAALGKPKIVRDYLARYHLLEMPEEWNQITFDDHVHDAYTKGRKTPTHLIMDAWIKGIRRLRVIYYNHVEARVVAELMEAAEITGVNVRIGVEFPARFRGRYVHLIWTPRGFPDYQAFLCFLEDAPVKALMEEGKEVSKYQEKYVLKVLEAANEKHLRDICKRFGLEPVILDREEFLAYVGAGQMSLLHLAAFIHARLTAAMKERMAALKNSYGDADEAERERIRALVADMNHLDQDDILDDYLAPEKNPDIPDPGIVDDGPDVPELLKLTPRQILDRLTSLHTGHRITLNLTDLCVEDVLEILHQSEGAITRLEIFNLKDHVAGKTAHIPAIAELARAVNAGNAIALKSVVRSVMDRVAASDHPDRADRLEKLSSVLYDVSTLNCWYSANGLKARIGSDSTGRALKSPGMGFAVEETLPFAARREIRRTKTEARVAVPVRIGVILRKVYLPRKPTPGLSARFFDRLRQVPVFSRLGYTKKIEWEVEDRSIDFTWPGNVMSLGGTGVVPDNGVRLLPEPRAAVKAASFGYANTSFRYIMKIIAGFVPAFLTFFLTKDWWVLAFLGAPIWFGITGVRVILQSVLGGGGFRRSPLLKWNDLVSWERLSDSLLFTGFSVPLLDFLVKTVILDRGFGITTSTSPIMLYAILGTANGLYLAGHNIYRGFPRRAVFGNLFRSLLAVPLAFGINQALAGVLTVAGVVAVEAALQKWAAIISKTASDCLAGIIEGTSDRAVNLAVSERDYATKLSRMREAYEQIEMLFPETRLTTVLGRPEKYLPANSEARGLMRLLIIHCLDMLYFWMYQPRARTAIRDVLEKTPEEERRLFFLSQGLLKNQKDISMMFLDGIVGPNFSKALAFYLDRSTEYLKDVDCMAKDWETTNAT